MILLKEEVNTAAKSVTVGSLTQGQAFVKEGYEIELHNVYIALFEYNEHDSDVVCLPLCKSGGTFKAMEGFRDDFYLDRDTAVIPVTLGVDSITQNAV